MGSTWAQRIRVGVDCADALIARGIAAVLAAEPDLAVVEAAWPGTAGVEVLVTDFDRAMARIGTAGPRPALLVYSPARRECEIRQALAHGLAGFLGPGLDLAELPQAVRILARGGRYYDSATTRCAAASLASEALTGRELQVLGLIARGECNKTIAARLDVTVGTVKAHVGAILAKLQVVSRTQAARAAFSRGLIDGLVDGAWDAPEPPGHAAAPRRHPHPANATPRNPTCLPPVPM